VSYISYRNALWDFKNNDELEIGYAFPAVSATLNLISNNLLQAISHQVRKIPTPEGSNFRDLSHCNLSIWKVHANSDLEVLHRHSTGKYKKNIATKYIATWLRMLLCMKRKSKEQHIGESAAYILTALLSQRTLLSIIYHFLC